jgi:hypothetical protein
MEPTNAIKYTKIIKYTSTSLVDLRASVFAIIVHTVNVIFFRICTKFYMQDVGVLTGSILIRNKFYGTVQTHTSYLHANMPILFTAESVHTVAVSALINIQSNTFIPKRISTLRLCITGQAVSSSPLAEFHY